MTKQESTVLDRLSEKVVQLSEDNATIKSEIRHLTTNVDKVVHSIVGNGQPGLSLRMDRLEQRQKVREKVVWWFTTTIGSIVLGGLGTIIWNLL